MKYCISDIDGVLIEPGQGIIKKIVNKLKKSRLDKIVIVTNRKKEYDKETLKQLDDIKIVYGLPITEVFPLTISNKGDKVQRIKTVIRKYGNPKFFIENDPRILNDVHRAIPDLTLYYVEPAPEYHIKKYTF